MSKNKYKEMIEEEFDKLASLNDLSELSKKKYYYTLKAKKSRDNLIITNAAALIITILVSFVTISVTINKTINDKGTSMSQRIDDINIDIKKIGVDKMGDEKIEKLKLDIIGIIKVEGKAAINDIQNELNGIYTLGKIIGILSLGIIIVYFIIIKIIGGEASRFETLVIMIDERRKVLEKEKIENEAIKKIGEIDKTVEGTKREVETLVRIFSNFKK